MLFYLDFIPSLYNDPSYLACTLFCFHFYHHNPSTPNRRHTFNMNRFTSPTNFKLKKSHIIIHFVTTLTILTNHAFLYLTHARYIDNSSSTSGGSRSIFYFSLDIGKFLPSFGIYFYLRRLRCQISFLRHSFHQKSELNMYICTHIFFGHVVP
jgi:hypothetical protein